MPGLWGQKACGWWRVLAGHPGEAGDASRWVFNLYSGHTLRTLMGTRSSHTVQKWVMPPAT